MKFLSRIFTATASIVVATSFTLSAAELTDSVLARVGDKVVTSFDVRVAAQEAESQLPPTLSDHDRMEAVAEIRGRILDEMIFQELVWLDFKELKAKIPPAAVQERIDRVIQAQANASEERFRDMLHRDNITYKEFEEKVSQQLAVEMLVYDRTRRGIFIRDEEIAKYFEENKDSFRQPTSYRLQAILLKKGTDDAWRKTFDEVQKHLRDGEEFAAVAQTFSQGAAVENGGDMGWMTEKTMAPALFAVAGKLPVGSVAPDPVEIGGNAYVIRLAERKGGDDPVLNDEIRDAIRRTLEEQSAAKRKEEYRQTLLMKYPVRVY